MPKKLLIIVIIVLVLGALIFWYYLQGANLINKGNNSNNQATIQSNPELEKKYEQQLKIILKPFWTNNDPDNLQEQILELRAPAKYLDLHLNIVLAFDLINQGRLTEDQAKIEEGLEKLNQLKKQYSWLN